MALKITCPCLWESGRPATLSQARSQRAGNRTGGLGAPSSVPGCVEICVCGPVPLSLSFLQCAVEVATPPCRLMGKFSVSQLPHAQGLGYRSQAVYSGCVCPCLSFGFPAAEPEGHEVQGVGSGWVFMTGSGGGRERSCVWGKRGLGSRHAHMALCHPPA